MPDTFWITTDDTAWVDADDTWSPTLPIVIEDSGSGTDAISCSVSGAVVDSGSGSEDVSSTQIGYGLAEDSGDLSDVLAFSIGPVIVTDSGSGVDVPDVPTVFEIAEDMSSTEAILVTPSVIVLTEAFSSADTIYAVSSVWADTEDNVWADADDTWVPHDVAPTVFLVLDSGTGSDSVEIASQTKTVVVEDSGVGTDLSVTPEFLFTDTPNAFVFVTDADFEFVEHMALLEVIEDTGTGSEAVVLAVSAGLSDFGSGSEEIDSAATALKSASDSGAGSDSIHVVVSLGVADSGAGQEEIGPIKTVVLVEDLTGTDAVLLAVSALVTDSGAGTDEALLLTAVTRLVSDSGQGVESVEIANAPVIEETLTGTDSVESTFAVVITDTLSGTDETATLKQPTAVDSASGSDVVLVPAVSLGVVDTFGADEEVIRIGGSEKQATDAGVGSEEIFRPVVFAWAADSAQGADAVIVSVPVEIPDSLSGSDEVAVARIIVIADSAAGSEVTTVLISAITLTDSVSLEFDAPIVSVATAVSDAAAFTEIVSGYLTGDKVVVDYGVFWDGDSYPFWDPIPIIAGPGPIVIIEVLDSYELVGKSLKDVRIMDTLWGVEVIDVVELIESLLLESSVTREMAFNSYFEMDRAVNE